MNKDPLVQVLNRYCDILPCNPIAPNDQIDNDTRIVLKGGSKTTDSYINANYINVFPWRVTKFVERDGKRQEDNCSLGSFAKYC